jgi:plastocyanin
LGQAGATKPSSSGRLGLIVAVVVIVVVIIAVLLYLPGSHPALTSTTSTGPTSASIQTVTVSIPAGISNKSNALNYVRSNITVVIGVNNTVVWINLDTASGQKHSVTSSSVPSGAQPFDSGIINGTRTTFTVTFTVPGTYQYHCIYHDWMIGKVKVVSRT